MKKKNQGKERWVSSKDKGNGWRFGLGVGYTHLVANMNGFEQLPSYEREFRRGVMVSAGVHYFFVKYFGIGLHYSYFNTTASHPGVTSTSNFSGDRGFGPISDNVNVHFPSFDIVARYPLKSEVVIFIVGTRLGYMHWTNHTHYLEDFDMVTSAYGSSIYMGLDVKVYGGFTIGADFNVDIGAGKTINLDNGQRSFNVDAKLEMTKISGNVNLKYFLR